MRSVSFMATLSDQGGWFDGTTEEIGSVGDAAGRTLTASLQGRRAGQFDHHAEDLSPARPPTMTASTMPAT